MRYRSATVADFHGLPHCLGLAGQRTTDERIHPAADHPVQTVNWANSGRLNVFLGRRGAFEKDRINTSLDKDMFLLFAGKSP